MSKVYRLTVFAWFISIAVSTAAIVAWGQNLDWQFADLSLYQLFPLFGLTAFGIMWAHYIVAAIRRYLGLPLAATARFFEITSLTVLLSLLLHPLLLAWQLWADGFGLPPQSVLQNYVTPALRWMVVLGVISLVVFLAFELRRKYAGRSWWRYINYANDLAILAVFYHALSLGGELQSGWYQKLWLFYGITLVLALIYSYWHKSRYTDLKPKQEEL